MSLSDMKIQRTWTEHLLGHGHSYASLIDCQTTQVPRTPLPYFYSTNGCTAARACLCAAFEHKNIVAYIYLFTDNIGPKSFQKFDGSDSLLTSTCSSCH